MSNKNNIPHKIKFSDEQLEEMYFSYMKRKYEGTTVDSNIRFETLEEFKKKMLDTEWITLNPNKE